MLYIDHPHNWFKISILLVSIQKQLRVIIHTAGWHFLLSGYSPSKPWQSSWAGTYAMVGIIYLLGDSKPVYTYDETQTANLKLTNSPKNPPTRQQNSNYHFVPASNGRLWYRAKRAWVTVEITLCTVVYRRWRQIVVTIWATAVWCRRKGRRSWSDLSRLIPGRRCRRGDLS